MTSAPCLPMCDFYAVFFFFVVEIFYRFSPSIVLWTIEEGKNPSALIVNLKAENKGKNLFKMVFKWDPFCFDVELKIDPEFNTTVFWLLIKNCKDRWNKNRRNQSWQRSHAVLLTKIQVSVKDEEIILLKYQITRIKTAAFFPRFLRKF